MARDDGVVIEWLGGNCPVQAEGTFDGEAFYFRARGGSVTCDVGEWAWGGPEYEWPDAGWVSEELARAYINAAYVGWKNRGSENSLLRAKYRRRNGLMSEAMSALRWAGWLEKEIGDGAKPAHDRLMAHADKMLKAREGDDHE